MKIRKVIPLRIKLFLPIMGIVITVVFITTLWFINSSIRTFNNQVTNSIMLEVQTISKMFERERMLKLEKVETNLRIADLLFQQSPLTVTNQDIAIEIENQESGLKHTTQIPVWLHAGIRIYGDTIFTDLVEGVAGGSVTIFQRSDSGFVRVATNIRREDGERAVGTFIPNSSPVSITTLGGETYYGRAFVVNEWYTTAYKPLFAGEEIDGLIYVGDKEKDMSELKRILSRLKIGESGYPFVFDSGAKLLIHPHLEGEIWERDDLTDQIMGREEGLISYREQKHDHVIVWRYFEPFDLYIAATANIDAENRQLVRNATMGAIIVGLIAIGALLILIYRFTTEKLYNYLNALEKSEEQLASAREALRQSEKLAHMGQISAGIAHELNNPLGVITMYSNILLDELPQDSPMRKDLTLIAEQAERCKKIVGGLLNFARKNRVVPREVNITELLEKSISAVVIPENITAIIESDLNDPMVVLDSEQMMQLFTNLEKNGIEAMPDGGELKISVFGNNQQVEVIVADTGKGIPPGNLDKLFTPFFTTKQVGKGTGLGLALVYGIVKMHRGKIDVKSNHDPSKGATGTQFTITLPRVHQ